VGNFKGGKWRALISFIKRFIALISARGKRRLNWGNTWGGMISKSRMSENRGVS